MAATKNVSDEKALLVSQATKQILAKVSPQHTVHDAPRWTEDMEDILLKLPSWAVTRLAMLIQEGPYERPEA